MEFWGDGYDYLLSSFNTDPLSEVTCLVEYKQESDTEYTSFYNGIIRLSDVKFNLSRCLAKTEIEDNSWYAKILNNRELKSVVDVALSKDGTTINADSGSSIEFLDPSNGNTYGGGAENRVVYTAFGVLRHLVEFVSNGEVSFSSDYFSSGDGVVYTITTGAILSGSNSEAPNGS